MRHSDNNNWSNSIFCMNIDLKNSSTIRIIIYFLLSVAILIPIVTQLLHPVADVDSGYYLSISNRICEGYKLYEDVACGYTPLYLYICAVFRWLLDIPYNVYWPYLLLQQLFRIGCAGMVYGIAKEFKASTWWAIVAAFYCLFILVRVEGWALLLEVPSAFFGLAACYSILRYRDENTLHGLWIGVLIACSFLTKQYGLGFLPLVLYLIFTQTIKGNRFIRSVYTLIGFFIPVIIIYFYFGHAFVDILFPSYGTQSAVEAGLEWSFSERLLSIIRAIFNCLKTNSIIIALSIGLLPIAYKHGVLNNWLVTLFGFLGFSLQFYFTNNSGGHYLLYMLPFTAIAIANVVSIKYKRWLTSIVYLCIAYMILWQGYRMFAKNVPYWLNDRTEMNYIAEVTEACNKYIPANSIVWVEPIYLIPVYFYADILPPNIESIGYSFGPLGISKQTALKQIDATEYIIMPTEGKSSYDFSSEILEEYIKNHFDRIVTFGSLAIYKKDYEYPIQ